MRAPTSFRPPWVSDYVIDVAASAPLAALDGAASGAFLYVGDQEYVARADPRGGFALVSAEMPVAQAAAPLSWTLHARFPSAATEPKAHADIVRCVHWDDATQRLYTGGEDGRLLAWSLDVSASSAPVLDDAPAPAPAPERPAVRSRLAGAAATKRRYSPYA